MPKKSSAIHDLEQERDRPVTRLVQINRALSVLQKRGSRAISPLVNESLPHKEHAGRSGERQRKRPSVIWITDLVVQLQCKTGVTIENLAASLSTSVGDVRAALYDLAESKCVRFSNGMWRLE